MWFVDPAGCEARTFRADWPLDLLKVSGSDLGKFGGLFAMLFYEGSEDMKPVLDELLKAPEPEKAEPEPRVTAPLAGDEPSPADFQSARESTSDDLHSAIDDRESLLVDAFMTAQQLVPRRHLRCKSQSDCVFEWPCPVVREKLFDPLLETVETFDRPADMQDSDDAIWAVEK